MTRSQDSLVGTTLGGCKILRSLAQGGMGRVYYGLQTSLERPVAVKVLAPKLASDEHFVQFFRREARTVAQLNHPNIVQTYSFGEENGRFFLVMEYVPGETLAQVLERQGPLEARRAANIVLQAAQALEAAWARGIVHRDIKPGNLLITAEGAVKVTDFGLAKKAGGETLSRPSELLGTAQYMSPEQIMGGKLDIRSDLYSLALTFWHALAGTPPFRGESDSSVLFQQVEDPVPDVRTRAKDAPEALASLIARMARKEPHDRPRDPAEVVQALKAFLAKESAFPAGLERSAAAELLSALVESSSDAIVAIGLDSVIRSWNSGARRTYGYAPEEAVGRPFTMLVPPDRQGEFAELVRKAEAGGEVENFEVVRLAKGGRTLELSVSWSPIRSADGKVIGISTIGRDVSKQKELERQLRKTEKMEAIGRLSGALAHDFNNLMTAVLGCSELLQAALPPGDPNVRLVEMIHQAGERAASLTHQLLSFGEGQILPPALVSLNETLTGLLPQVRSVLGQRVGLETAFDPAVGQVKVDRLQLGQILTVLGSNARDAMPQGGTFTLRTSRGELPPSGRPAAILEATDTGGGMDEGVRARLFEPFFTTKPPGLGTGVGLATVQAIVKGLGGEIEVRSQVGRGTSFRISIPLYEEPRPVALPAAAPSGRGTVLLVEDERVVRMLAREILQREGYQVIEAKEGADALEAARRHSGPISLLLTDVVMPGMGGLELARAFAELRPGTPILFMSAFSEDPALREAASRPGAGFLPKPFTVSELAAKLRQLA